MGSESSRTDCIRNVLCTLYPTMGVLQVRDGAGTRSLGREVSAPARVMSIMSGKIY